MQEVGLSHCKSTDALVDLDARTRNGAGGDDEQVEALEASGEKLETRPPLQAPVLPELPSSVWTR